MAWYDPSDWEWEDVATGAGLGALGLATGGAGFALPLIAGGALLGGAGGEAIGSGEGGVVGDVFGDIFNPGTQQTTQAPWGPQQPYLQNLFSQANELYNQGAPLTPEMSALTQQYLSGLPSQISGTQNLLGGGTGALQNIYGGGLSPLSGEAGQYLKGAASGQYLAPNPLQGMAGQYLRGTAGGEFLGSNPYLEQMYQQGAQKLGQTFQDITMPGINQVFGGSAGAFGSGAHQALTGQAQQQLGGALGDLYTNINMPAYEAERGRQQQAALGLGGLGADLYTTERGLQQQAGMGLGNLGIADIGTRLSATGQLPGYAGAGMDVFSQYGAAGQIPEQFGRERAMDPWRRLQMYGQGVTGQYGGTTTMPGQSPFDRFLDVGSKAGQVALPFLV